jgi:hypothetical protein
MLVTWRMKAMRATMRFPLAAILWTSAALPAAAQTLTVDWATKLGTSEANDHAGTCVPDGAGGTLVGGATGGSLAGPIGGNSDIWIARYDSAGNQAWIHQFGSSQSDGLTASAPDGSGGVYLVGWTLGSLAGPHAGEDDAWLARYDGAGNLVWSRQLGTSADDSIEGAASDGAGGLFVVGASKGDLGGGVPQGNWDVWVAHYDSAGNQTWTELFGTSSSDSAGAAAPDGSGGLFVGGTTGGDLGGPNAGLDDAWIARFDSTGNQQWIRQFGSISDEWASAAASDGAGGVYFAGAAPGNLDDFDAWIARFDGSGNQHWIRQVGSTQNDYASFAVSADLGGVVAGGTTYGDLGGVSIPGPDLWLARFDASGVQEWIENFGSAGSDYGLGAMSNGAGGLFVAGSSNGDFGGPSLGHQDGVVAHLVPTCFTPPTVYCTAKPNSLGCLPTIAMLGLPNTSTGSGGTVVVTNVVGAMFGIFFHSTAGANAMPFHDGFLCVSPPLLRHGLLNSGGTAGTCTGSFSEQFNATSPAAPIRRWSPEPRSGSRAGRATPRHRSPTASATP